MSLQIQCESCLYFLANELAGNYRPEMGPPTIANGGMSYCRRRSPHANAGMPYPAFPLTLPEGWCGECAMSVDAGGQTAGA